MQPEPENPVMGHLKTELGRSPALFESLEETLSPMREYGWQNAASQLAYRTNLSNDHILQQVISVPELHQDLKRFTNCEVDGLAQIDLPGKVAHMIKRAPCWPLTQDPNLDPTPARPDFVPDVVKFYNSQILKPCFSLATIIHRGDGGPNYEHLKLRPVLRADANQAWVDATLSYSESVTAPDPESTGPERTLAVVHFHDPHFLTDGTFGGIGEEHIS
ncbi:hypothetical protein BDN72DRAFT_861980 [Pluteus cervinus]|uniref:Uncharacterized protein n=1 Tax=Pluteus cervinus TaxID=181527 RepID=A0ACD3AD85_9AGAR|nr:hypothetical protein BDN72DRAFT_861980 [Pluteus cervinus]